MRRDRHSALVRACGRLLQSDLGVLLITHSQVAENVVFFAVRHVARRSVGKPVQGCKLLAQAWLASRRARARLGPFECLKVVLVLLLQGHVLRGAARVRSGSRRHLVVDRLEVPWQTF